VAENITGVGDANMNAIPDRMLRFNKEYFVKALFGETGQIASVVRGGLGETGTPRFLATIEIAVFAPPKKK